MAQARTLLALAATAVLASPPARAAAGDVPRARADALLEASAGCKVVHPERCEPLAALIALGPGIAPHARRFLGDKQPATRTAAVLALGLVRAEADGPALLARLADDDMRVRMAAMTAVGTLRPEGALDGLLGALGRAEPQEKATAAAALGALGSPAAVAPLVAALDHFNPMVRAAAARSLGALGDARAVAPLAVLLATPGTPPLVLEAACDALGRLGSPDAVPMLLLALPHREAPVRVAAITALGLLRDDRAVPALGELLKGAVHTREAADALGRIGSADALPALIRVLKEPQHDRELLRRVFYAVGSIGQRSAGPAVRPLLRHTDAEVATWAAEALGRVKDDESTPELVAALSRSEVDVRQMAAWSLQELYGQNLGQDPARWTEWLATVERTQHEAEQLDLPPDLEAAPE